MNVRRWVSAICVTAIALVLAGCAAPKVSVAKFSQPERDKKLDAFDTFVGKWNWEAELLNAADEADKNWTGTAEWRWTLDDRALHGSMSAKCGDMKFEAAGIWSWHPKNKKYIWWMFNNWGYPQQGTATYNEECNCWVMSYKSVGLDGTTSYGRYTMSVKDKDTLDWKMVEWADAFRTIKKMEMTGTYRRAK